jgi:serine/threonine protein kinase
MAKPPWDDDWSEIQKLDQGGQGYTFLVESRQSAGQRAVLKKLKNNKDHQARARMHREYTNLRVLASIGVNVPKVLAGNTDQYEKDGVQLFFVMEFVDGKTLKKEVEERGRLPFEEASAIVLSLLSTLAAAHAEGIVHRDLKPDNIIVRDMVKKDLVIIDYGLSFNRDEAAETITQTGDTFRNKFLDLPETNTESGNFRDPRSDVTAAVAVLFYCLTGRVPGHLQDSRGLAPHRRPGSSVQDALGGGPRAEQMALLMDVGLAQHIESRFQTVDELARRLRQLASQDQAAVEDPVLVASQLSDLLRQQDRKTQLEELRGRVGGFSNLISQQGNKLSMALNQRNSRFGFHMGGNFGFNPPQQVEIPDGLEDLQIGVMATVTVQAHQNQRVIQLKFGAKGNQCAVIGRVSGISPPAQVAPGMPRPGLVNSPVSKSSSWKVLWFDPDGPPELSGISGLFDELVNRAMKELHEEVLTLGAKA